jgi:hypothetical protein
VVLLAAVLLVELIPAMALMALPKVVVVGLVGQELLLFLIQQHHKLAQVEL